MFQYNKENNQSRETQLMKSEKTLASHVSDHGLMFKICEEHIELNSKKEGRKTGEEEGREGKGKRGKGREKRKISPTKNSLAKK